MKLQLEIYVDILFVINLGMNFCILALVRKIRKLHTSLWKTLFGAGIGAVIACFIALFFRGSAVLAFILEYVITANLIVYLAFGFHSLIEYVHNYFSFLFITFLLGGMIQSIFQTLGIGYYFKEFHEKVMHSEITITIIIVLSAVLTPVVAYVILISKQCKKTEQLLYNVVMFAGGRQFSCKGLLDTGNSLYEPLSGRPVVIVNSEFLKKDYEEILQQKPSLYCVIPYNSVGKEHGLLYGLRLEKIIVSNSEEEYCTDNVIVALSEHKFSKQQDYHVLLHQDLLDLKTN